MTAVCSVLSASISLCISPSLYVSRSLSVCYSFIVSLSMRFSIDIYISVCLCVWVSLCWFTCSSSSVCRCLHVSACLSLVCSLYLSSFACHSQSIYRKLSITSFYCLSQNLSSSVQVSRPSKSPVLHNVVFSSNFQPRSNRREWESPRNDDDDDKVFDGNSLGTISGELQTLLCRCKSKAVPYEAVPYSKSC